MAGVGRWTAREVDPGVALHLDEAIAEFAAFIRLAVLLPRLGVDRQQIFRRQLGLLVRAEEEDLVAGSARSGRECGRQTERDGGEWFVRTRRHVTRLRLRLLDFPSTEGRSAMEIGTVDGLDTTDNPDSMVDRAWERVSYADAGMVEYSRFGARHDRVHPSRPERVSFHLGKHHLTRLKLGLNGASLRGAL